MFRKIILPLITVSLLVSCSGRKKNYSGAEYSGQSSLQIKQMDDEEKAFIKGKTICVVLAYGYENEDDRARITADLEQNFGIKTEEKDGLITLYFFPDDFKSHGPVRISQLAENLEEAELAGIIVYGAPEGMNIPLAKLQDRMESENKFYPIFSFMPQDDILGSEATSDFVVDYALKASDMDSEEAASIQNFNPDLLIINSVNKIISSRGKVPSGPELKDYVSDIVEQEKILSYYHDSETGLKSIKHFIFE